MPAPRVRGFLTGFTLGLANPPRHHQLGARRGAGQAIGLATPLTHAAKAWFVAGGALGLGSYLAALAVVVHRVRTSSR